MHSGKINATKRRRLYAQVMRRVLIGKVDMNIKIVVPISGGKDSQACLQLALERHDKRDVLGLFCDTGWEHPKTYAHIEWMREYYGVNIERISAGTVEQKVIKYNTFPARLVRFCTDELKIQPAKIFYKDLAEKQGGFSVFLGMRSGESRDRKERYKDKISLEKYAPHEIMPGKMPKYLYKSGVSFVLPILDWSSQDVFDYLEGKENPLYTDGFDRVGCFPCLAQGANTHNRALNFDVFGASQKQRIIELEKAIGKKHKPANTDQMCMFCHI